MKKIVSIDIETLGLEPEVCDMIEFGAVIDDPQILNIEQLPFFHCYLTPPKRELNGKIYEFYRGEAFAMNMNNKIIETISKRKDKEIADKYQFLEPRELGMQFAIWLAKNGFNWNDQDEPIKIKVAGKNFEGFDMRFLRRLPEFNRYISFHHRVHNPAQLYFDRKNDDDLPSLDVCLQRAGIETKVSHNAVEDAMDVIRVLRHKWN